MKARRKAAIVVGTAALMLAMPVAAQATVRVNANGNAFVGGLSFTPGSVTARVGEQIIWKNTDFIAPHTVTENHGLFDLVGNNVNGTPVSPSGFGPGTTVSRAIEAGTIQYYCRVHPKEMRAAVAVPVTLSAAPASAAALRRAAADAKAKHKRRHKRRKHKPRPPVPPAATGATITATWAPSAPAAGKSFDVQVKQGGGDWQSLADNTTATSMSFPGGAPRTTWTVRARLRSAADPSKATGWSPDASVTS